MTAAAWLEVSLTVDGELAEAVAEVLARFAPDGVVDRKHGCDCQPGRQRRARRRPAAGVRLPAGR